MFGVTKEDIQTVAKNTFGRKLSKKQVNQILKEYPNAQKEDPTSTWNLVIENQIYENSY